MTADDWRREQVAEESAMTTSDQEREEALITAYALGQLDADERARAERLIADPKHADARVQLAEVRAIATALRAGAGSDAPSRSAGLRQAVLAAVAQSDIPRRQKVGRRWILVISALAASVLVAITLSDVRRRLGPDGERLVADARDRANRTADQSGLAEPKATGLAEPEETFEPLEKNEPTDARKSESRAMAPRRGAPDADAVPRAASAPVAGPPVGSVAAGKSNGIADKRQSAVESDRLARSLAEREAAEDMGQPVSGSRRFLFRADERGAEPPSPERRKDPSFPGEGYASITEQRPLSPKDHPLSTFSVDVDTASYANVRRFLDAGRLPPREAVRIEELLNYFAYDYPQPDGDVPFSVTVDAAECPWKSGRRLVRIGLRGRDIATGSRPAGNLVFLVDVSGSMQAANKLPLVRQSLSMLVDELTENDRVSIVTYAGDAGLVLPPTTGDRKELIRGAIESLAAGGSTHGSAGIALAYEQALEHFVDGGANRVILATDGDLNVGVTSTSDLTALITEKAKGGVFLTVLGFGEGNLQDDKMEALADNGNGIYAYIDGAREARKVLVEQLCGSTVTISKDVKIQVEFNPAQVASYRLLGYENRTLAARDFRDDSKDAGEIGAGHRVTALYEIGLVDEASIGGPGIDQLRYQPRAETAKPEADAAVNRELLTVKLRWKRPADRESSGLEVPFADRGPTFAKAPDDLRFAAAVAAFGMVLRDSDQRGDATLPMAAEIAARALGRDEGGYRAEFLDLVRKAELLRGR